MKARLLTIHDALQDDTQLGTLANRRHYNDLLGEYKRLHSGGGAPPVGVPTTLTPAEIKLVSAAYNTVAGATSLSDVIGAAACPIASAAPRKAAPTCPLHRAQPAAVGCEACADILIRRGSAKSDAAKKSSAILRHQKNAAAPHDIPDIQLAPPRTRHSENAAVVLKAPVRRRRRAAASPGPPAGPPAGPPIQGSPRQLSSTGKPQIVIDFVTKVSWGTKSILVNGKPDNHLAEIFPPAIRQIQDQLNVLIATQRVGDGKDDEKARLHKVLMEEIAKNMNMYAGFLNTGGAFVSVSKLDSDARGDLSLPIRATINDEEKEVRLLAFDSSTDDLTATVSFEGKEYELSAI